VNCCTLQLSIAAFVILDIQVSSATFIRHMHASRSWSLCDHHQKGRIVIPQQRRALDESLKLNYCIPSTNNSRKSEDGTHKVSGHVIATKLLKHLSAYDIIIRRLIGLFFE